MAKNKKIDSISCDANDDGSWQVRVHFKEQSSKGNEIAYIEPKKFSVSSLSELGPMLKKFDGKGKTDKDIKSFLGM